MAKTKSSALKRTPRGTHARSAAPEVSREEQAPVLSNSNDKVDDRERSLIEEFDSAPKLYRRIQRVAMAYANLWAVAVTLTYPAHFRIDWIFKSAHWLAKKLRREEFMLLVLDKGGKGKEQKRPHWHGIFFLVSEERIEKILRQWAKRMSSSRAALKAVPLQGQDGDRSGEYFKRHLRQWSAYCCKRAPELELTLQERVVATGAMEECWQDLFGQPSQGPYFLIEVRNGVVRPTSLGRENTGPRLCRLCELPLPDDYPSNKWYHDGCSRQAAHKKRQGKDHS